MFILKPGQHVHINKGRLHAFRKLVAEPLPELDCHSSLRQELLLEHRFERSPVCVSIAWDWQFTGINADGINREVTSCLESQILVGKVPNLKCLAIPKASLLSLGQNCRNLNETKKLPMFTTSSAASCKSQILSTKNLLCGICPSLSYVLEENIAFIKRAHRKMETRTNPLDGCISIASSSDTSLNPLSSAVDPDGNDYFCKLCNTELENVYLHCDGCENLLQKDFNICMDCHESGRYRTTVDMHGRGLQSAVDRTSTVNHTGDMCPKKGSSCICNGRVGSPCPVCGLCNGKICTLVRWKFYLVWTLTRLTL